MVAVDEGLTQVGPPGTGPAWLGTWRGWLDDALAREVQRMRARYQPGADELRGIYISDAQVDALLADRPGEPTGLDADLAGRRDALLVAAWQQDTPLARVAQRFGLGPVEQVGLVLALAAEVDPARQAVLAYLNDDPTRRLPSVATVEALAGLPLEPTHPVLADGLLLAVRSPAAPLWRTAGLVLADPVRAYLRGTDPLGGPREVPPRRVGLVLLESRTSVDAALAAEQLAAHDGRALVRVGHPGGGADAGVTGGAGGADAGLTWGLGPALLRARLHDAALLVPVAGATGGDAGVDPADSWGASTGSGLGLGGAAAGRYPTTGAELAALADCDIPVLLEVRPGAVARMPLAGLDHQHLVVDRPGPHIREALWQAALAGHGLVADPSDVATVAQLFALGPGQVRAAAAVVARGGDTGHAALAGAARDQVAQGVAGLAERVRAEVGWDDLVLPAPVAARLRSLEAAIRMRHQVFDDWGLARLAGGHRSIRALFSGPSGTGKTMAASVVAGSLGLALHRVDLSAVVSKYIGETEKNLARVFHAAEDGGAILFFDEADALFGKRTEVRDAHDRYANIETSFLLQRMESFDGVVVLASNLAGNLDEAFARRIHVHVEFPAPDQRLREQLWVRAFPPAVPVASDVDPAVLAGMVALTGGEVRTAALTAAFAAAQEGAAVSMAHVVRAVARLRRQQGKVPSAAEFGSYLHLAREGEA